MPINPYLVLRRSPPGTAALISGTISQGREVCWLIRAEPATIEKWEAVGATIRTRFGLTPYKTAQGKDVLIVVIMMSLGEGKDATLYEVLVNEHDKAHLAPRIEDLTTYPTIPIHFVIDESGNTASRNAANTVKPIAVRALAQIASCPPWSQADFDVCAEQLYKQYPTKAALWEAIGN